MSLCCNVLRSYHDECDGYILHFKQWYQPKTSLFQRGVKRVTEAATLPYSWATSITWRLLLIIHLIAPESCNIFPSLPLAPNICLSQQAYFEKCWCCKEGIFFKCWVLEIFPTCLFLLQTISDSQLLYSSCVGEGQKVGFATKPDLLEFSLCFLKFKCTLFCVWI